jgi:serine/threonine protein kinase
MKIMTYRTSKTIATFTPAKVSDRIYLGEDFDPNSGFCEYEIIKEIGEGGFGKVLLATHKNMQEPVAIKVIKADKITNAQSIDQVFREIENLKAMRHPNIVKIHNCYALKGMQVVMIM